MDIIAILLVLIVVIYLADFFQLSVGYAALKFYKWFVIGLVAVAICWYLYPGETSGIFFQFTERLQADIEASKLEACRHHVTFFCPGER